MLSLILKWVCIHSQRCLLKDPGSSATRVSRLSVSKGHSPLKAELLEKCSEFGVETLVESGRKEVLSKCQGHEKAAGTSLRLSLLPEVTS